MLGAYPIATRPLATLQEVAGPTGVSLWINTRLELDGAAESGIVQNFWGAGVVSLFGHVYDPIALPPVYVDSTIQQPTPFALVSPVHQTYSDATIVIDPSGDALATPDHVIRSTSLYEYEPYLEDHYIQTDATPDFMWSPNGASGVEAVTGKYTVFIKLLQFDPRDTNYWRFLHLYDDLPTNEQQVTDYMVQHYTFFDRVIFGGNTTTGAANWQYQMAAATSAKDQGIQVLAITVNQSTNKARSMIAAGGSTLLNAEAGFTADRQPLHVAINALVRNISGVHTSQGQNARFKFIAAGVLSDVASSAELASYSTVGDARRIWDTKLYSYWTATSMYDSVSPKLKNLGATMTTPMYLNSLGFSQRYALPSAHIADAFASPVLNTTYESTQTPIDADVLVEITVTAVDLFIEAHMPLVPSGESFFGQDHYTHNDYIVSTSATTSSGQTNTSFDAVYAPVDPDVVSGLSVEANANTTTPVDPDVIAGVQTSSNVAGRVPVDADTVTAIDYSSVNDARIVVDPDVSAGIDNATTDDARLVTAASNVTGIDVSSDDASRVEYDADVSVIVNVTTTDLDIEAHIPTVTDDVFLVEENNAQWASAQTPVDADVVVIVNVTTTDLDIEAELPTVTDDVFLVQSNNTASSQATATVNNSSSSGISSGASVAPSTPVDPDVPVGIDSTASAAGKTVAEAASIIGQALTAYEAAAYEYDGGLEQHYIQTHYSGFMWSPNSATGVELENGKYTIFIKVLSMFNDGSWPYAGGGHLMTAYDDSASPAQNLATISSSYYYEDVIQFFGMQSDGSFNFFSQTQFAWQTTPFVASITFDFNAMTVTYKAYHKNYPAIYYYTDSIYEARPPLHIGLNALIANFGMVHSGVMSYSEMKFMAAGLLAGEVTDQQLQDYAFTRDARPIFGSALRSYWAASVIEGDPALFLPDQVGNFPMYINSYIDRTDQHPVPRANQFTMESGVNSVLSANSMLNVEFDSDALIGVIDGLFAKAEIPLSTFTFAGIIYPPINIYVTTKVSVTPDAYLAFAAKCVKAYLTNEPGTQATFVDSAGTEALFVNEPGTVAVLIKCR